MAGANGYVNSKITLQADIVPDRNYIKGQVPGITTQIQNWLQEEFNHTKIQITGLEFDFSQVAKGLAASGLVAALKSELAKAGIKTVMSEVNDVAKNAAQTGKTETVKDNEKKTTTSAPKTDGTVKQDTADLISQLNELQALTNRVKEAQSALNKQPFSTNLRKSLQDDIKALQAYVEEFKKSDITGQAQAAIQSGTLSKEEQKQLRVADSAVNVAEASLSKAQIAGSDEVANLNRQADALKRVNEQTRELNQLQSALNKLEQENPNQNIQQSETWKNLNAQIKNLRQLHDKTEAEYNNLKSEYKTVDKVRGPQGQVPDEIQSLQNSIQKQEITRALGDDQWTKMSSKVSQYQSRIDSLNKSWKQYTNTLKEAQKYDNAGDTSRFTRTMEAADSQRESLLRRTDTLNRGLRKFKGEFGYLPDSLAKGQIDLSSSYRQADATYTNVAALNNPYMRNVQKQVDLNRELVSLYKQQAQYKTAIEKTTSNSELKSLQTSKDAIDKQIEDKEKSLKNAAKKLKGLEEPTVETETSKRLKDQLVTSEADRKLAYNKYSDEATDAKLIEQALQKEIKARQDYNKQREALSKKGLSTQEYDQEISKLNELKNARDKATQDLLARVSNYEGNLKKGDTLPQSLTDKVNQLQSLTDTSTIKEANTSTLNNNLNQQKQIYGQLINAQQEYINNQRTLDTLQPGDKNAQALEANVNKAKAAIDAYKQQLNALKAEASQIVNPNVTDAIRDKQAKVNDLASTALRNDVQISNVQANYGDLRSQGQALQKQIADFKANVKAIKDGTIDVNDSSFINAYNNLRQEKDAIEQNLQAYKQLANSRAGALDVNQKRNIDQLIGSSQNNFNNIVNDITKNIDSKADPRVTNINAQLDSINQLKTAAIELEKVYGKLGNNNLIDSDRARLEKRAQDLDTLIANQRRTLTLAGQVETAISCSHNRLQNVISKLLNCNRVWMQSHRTLRRLLRETSYTVMPVQPLSSTLLLYNSYHKLEKAQILLYWKQT